MSDQTTRTPAQIGGSDRGPQQLDEAKKNQGQRPHQDKSSDESGDEALASGRTQSREVDAGRGDKGTAPGHPGQPQRR